MCVHLFRVRLPCHRSCTDCRMLSPLHLQKDREPCCRVGHHLFDRSLFFLLKQPLLLQPAALAVSTQTTLESWFYLLRSRAGALFESPRSPTPVPHPRLLPQGTRVLDQRPGVSAVPSNKICTRTPQEQGTHKTRSLNEKKSMKYLKKISFLNNLR